MNPATEKAKKKLALALKITGLSMNAMSKKIGVADTTLSRLRKLDNPPEPRASTVERIDAAVESHISSERATEEQRKLYQEEYLQLLSNNKPIPSTTELDELMAKMESLGLGDQTERTRERELEEAVATDDQPRNIRPDEIPPFLRWELQRQELKSTRKASDRYALDAIANLVKNRKAAGTQTVTSLPDIPVYGTAAGSLIGSMQLEEGRQVSYVSRPHGLRSSSRAYALIVTGSSMAPKFEEGDLVFVDPDRKINAGDTIIIQTQNFNKNFDEPTRAYIKTFRGVMDNILYTEQLNPPAKLDFPMKGEKDGTELVYSYDRVLTTRELFDV